MVFNLQRSVGSEYPEYNWWMSACTASLGPWVATVFPQAIGMAAAFDQDPLYRVGR